MKSSEPFTKLGGVWRRNDDGLRCWVVTLEAARVIVWARNKTEAKQRLRTSMRPRLLLPDVKVRAAHDDEVPGLPPVPEPVVPLRLFRPPAPTHVPEDPVLASRLSRMRPHGSDWIDCDPAYL
jgi:hypothetical protein